jgi:hypothetical protein
MAASGALSPESAARITALLGQAKIECVPIGEVRPNPRNVKRHSRKQLTILKESIRQFGFAVPILVDEEQEILAGHARRQAALELGMSEIPIIRLTHLCPEEKRAFALAANKIAELSTWDMDRLQCELLTLTDPALELSFDFEITGFDTVEVDSLLSPSPVGARGTDRADVLPSLRPEAEPVTAAGEVWTCGDHLLSCNDPLDRATYEQLLSGAPTDVAFVDPPVHLLKPEQRGACLQTSAARLAAYVRSGGVVYWFTAPTHLEDLFQRVEPLLGTRKDLLVWTKGSSEPGSLYSSEYAHVVVHIVGAGAPVRQAQFARRKRHRTNVWQYPAVHGRDCDAKPVALLADALKDCSRRGDIVLDPFARFGATMLAAERTGRSARLIERDRAKCDLIVRRWQELTGGRARLAGGRETFAEAAERRANR